MPHSMQVGQKHGLFSILQRKCGKQAKEICHTKRKRCGHMQKRWYFQIGAPNGGFAQYFSGRSFLAPISTSQVGIFNVTFEPGCRNNWHIHHAKSGGGQILVCVAGRGYYQVEGKEAVEMKPGDCINIPAEVKHWHGAAPDEWFSHLAIEVPGENSSNEWLEPVSDEEYRKLK